MASVKYPSGVDTVAGRVRLIRSRLNRHGTKPLGWPEFSAFAGVSVGTAKHWEDRGQISHDSAVDLALRLTAAGYPCAADWIRKGTKPTPAWAESRPSVPHVERSVVRDAPRPVARVSGQGDLTPASVLAVLERMPPAMQRAAIAQAFARGLDHQELHGPGLLRVAMSVCNELRRLGFVGVAKEIESEMMQAVFSELAKPQ